ncbi:MAG TPA: hypothetical protein VME19_05835 [Streptosporangiaceae bacterium]|nr:hypothetical protein [Streptosporangiaceae bacterium]
MPRHVLRVPRGPKDEKQRRPFPNWLRQHNWLIGAPVKRSLIAYDHI